MEPNFLSRAVSPTAFFKLTDPSNFKLLRPSVWPLWHLFHGVRCIWGKNFFWGHRISRTQDLSLACQEISDCNGCWFILCSYKPSFNTLLFFLGKTEVTVFLSHNVLEYWTGKEWIACTQDTVFETKLWIELKRSKSLKFLWLHYLKFLAWKERAAVRLEYETVHFVLVKFQLKRQSCVANLIKTANRFFRVNCKYNKYNEK